MKTCSNQQYASPDGIPLCFDLYHPGGGVKPLVVFLHGGGWISGEREMYSEEAEWFSNYGFATATIDYRLAPLYPFPAAVSDVQAFVRYARENAEELQIARGQVAAMGNSAGGHLASMAGLCGKAYDGDQTERVNAVVDVCGLSDMTNPEETQFPISMSFIEQFLGGPYAGREEAYAEASPIVHVHEQPCPFLIVHGVDDDVVKPEQSQALHEALQAKGGRSKLVLLPGEGHSFSLTAWDNVRAEAVAFLKEVFDAR